MEEALVLITLAYSYPKDLLEKVNAVDGITKANLIYGPYDMYAIAETKTRQELRDIIFKIRQIEGIKTTLTCNVIPSRPEREYEEV